MTQCVKLEWLIAIDNEAFGHVRSHADFGIMLTRGECLSDTCKINSIRFQVL